MYEQVLHEHCIKMNIGRNKERKKCMFKERKDRRESKQEERRTKKKERKGMNAKKNKQGRREHEDETKIIKEK